MKRLKPIDEKQFDFVVVGSGAGGGPLAANLALAGFRVLLLEAGGKEDSLAYSVPAYAGVAIEDEYYRWDFFVRHYEDQAQQERDPKFTPSKNGILYPRASTLGGCTAHNAMITTYPADSDWENIARITGDNSWNPANMRRYFEKIENCRYLDPITAERTGHGVGGWLSVEKADTSKAPKDWQLQETLEKCKEEGGIGPINEHQDPNAISVNEQQSEGFFTVPQATLNMTRNGTKDFILEVVEQFPDRLVIETHSFATKILFDKKDNTKAVGIEYYQGSYLYAASPRHGNDCKITAPVKKTVKVKKEVILSCGTYNTPQLLMLSGIGPEDHLHEFGIKARVNLPGVGHNLQDRYEISLVNEMEEPFLADELADFSDDPEKDQFLKMWLQHREGPYNSMGSPLMYLIKSSPDKPAQDLILFSRAVRFQGYFPNWFWAFRPILNQFTWTILKAHTKNRGGRVRLKSNNPFDTPEINFHYFEEGTDKDGDDLNDILAGFKFARKLMEKSPFKVREVLPGKAVANDEDIKTYIRDQAWGHHTSCTCPIGSDNDPMAVLDGDFRVRGAKNLRVVDASVFPRIPGTFIVTPIFMISEKASDVIIQDYKKA